MPRQLSGTMQRSRFWLVAVLTALGPGAGAVLSADDGEALGLKVPPGFTITQYADDTLAHDIFSMTIDTVGRVVVSGPGYVRILVDADRDGKAERAINYADGPSTGAQGMFFLGRDLVCTGDAGLIQYTDANGDDQADGPPELFLKIKTGSEHHAHAVRRGPDGWWYLIAGNFAEVNAGQITEKTTSPVKNPRAGVIMRLKPDLSGGEVYCDGFRNAYDFDFDARGELFAYDSDGERDSSLPWYLPTRLFHVLPGGFHGWTSESCKRPDYVIDAAPVVTATGRGSPTGVVCYRHTQFPESYRGGLFILDWTFGRVLAVPLVRQGATYARQEAVAFITAEGQTGFAPTDAEVGIDGSLYVCVGGRGTHGTVYRVTYTGADASVAPPVKPAILTVNEQSTSDQRLRACLDAPQPQSSWSRVRWVPLATKLGAQPFLSTALDEQQPAGVRIRAVEILTDLFAGIPGTAAEILSTAKSHELRASAVWSLGTKPQAGMALEVLVPYLNDQAAIVRRRALETAARLVGDPSVLLPSLARRMNDDDRLVRLAAARMLAGLKSADVKAVADTTRKIGWKAALTTTIGYVWRAQSQKPAYNAYAVDLGTRILEKDHPAELKLEAVRLLQMAIGDLRQNDDKQPLFASYSSALDLESHERDLDPLRIVVAKVFPTGNRLVDLELSRLAAMLEPYNDELYNKLLAQVRDESSPVDDIHYLIVAARLPVIPGRDQREAVARALLDLDRKIARDNLPQDNNWNDRIGELYGEFVKRDQELPLAIVELPGFGRPGHVIFMSGLTEDQFPQGALAFTETIESDPNYPWNNDVVFVIGQDQTPEHLEMVRRQFEKFELRQAVLMVLAEDPDEPDREKFVAGLDSSVLEMLSTCVAALENFPPESSGVELASLVKLLRRLGAGRNEFLLRERVVNLLERNTSEKFEFVFGPAGYVPQSESIDRWTDWVTQQYPQEAAQHLGDGRADLTALRTRLAAISWETGDFDRGRKLYAARGCAQCHGGGKGLGPDLAGATGRFSRDDLFIAIALPNRDVSPRYQTTLIETKTGKVYTGLIVYESVEGLLVRNGMNQTFRIDAKDTESKRNLPTSLMPEGLLKDLTDQDLADLYSYMKSLAAHVAAREQVAADDDEDATETE